MKQDIQKIYTWTITIAVIFLVLLEYSQSKLVKELHEEKQALKNLAKFNELAANKKLGLANTKIASQEELIKQYNENLSKNDKEFEDFRKKHKLQIKSRDQVIASLSSKIKNGTTVVSGNCIPDETGKPGVISYSWSDQYGRFKLIDKDIWTPNNEELQVKQYFGVKGEIFADKSGKFRVRKIKIEELYDSGKEGETKLTPVPDSNIEIINNQFIYVTEDAKKSKTLADLLTLRPLAIADSGLGIGAGVELINVGKLIDYANIGFYGKLSTNLGTDLLSTVADAKMGIGINYHLIPPLFPANFAVGASINLPFSNLAAPIVTLDLMLYLTEDLNPFVEK